MLLCHHAVCVASARGRLITIRLLRILFPMDKTLRILENDVMENEVKVVQVAGRKIRPSYSRVWVTRLISDGTVGFAGYTAHGWGTNENRT